MTQSVAEAILQAMHQAPSTPFIPWFVLTGTLLLVLLSVAGVVVFLILRRKPTGEGGAGVCAKCGYAVHQLTSFTCPECGADLREVGIKKPGDKRGLVWVIALGVILLAFMCVCSGLFFVVAQPRRSVHTLHTTTTQTTPHPPARQPSP